jgi:hypothetical protein
VIPYNNDSQVSFIIRRTIGGVTKRYVERLEDGLETDCCVTGSAGVATTVWSGFGHLEGKTLDVIANGSYVGQKTVTGGNITLDVGALTIEAGLHYDAELEMLAIELAGPQGSIQGDAISVHQFIMRVSNSVGCLVRNKPIVFTRPTVNDAPPPTFSGDFPIGVTGWGNDSILIQRDKPYAFTLLAAMRKFTTNPG